MTTTKLPDEVREQVTRRFCVRLTEDARWVEDPLDERRIIWAPKATTERFDTWVLARKSGIAVFKDGRGHRNGWRKCHTDNFWVYYAFVLAEATDRVDIQPEGCEETKR